MSAFLSAILIGGLVLASAMRFGTVQAATEVTSIPKPSVPEFTVKLVDSSYDVPVTYSIDPYTGENVTIDGYHVENKTIQLTVKNQPHSSSYDFYYNVRVKGHFAEIWHVLYMDEHSPRMSDSEYTVLTFFRQG